MEFALIVAWVVENFRVEGPASAASCISRVFRFCYDGSVDPRKVQSALWHAYDNGAIYGLRVSLITGSRALPLLWYEVKKEDLKGRQAAMEIDAISDRIESWPPGGSG